MAKILPGSWPDVIPDALIEPGLEHDDSTVQAVVEGQHHFMCRYGIGHVGEVFFDLGGGPPPTAEVLVTAGAKTLVLEYLVTPRLAMGLGLIIMGRTDGQNGSRVYCDCVEDASASDSGMMGAGPQWFRFAHAFGASRSRTDTTLQISLMDGAGANHYCTLRALYIYDADLAAVP